MKLSVIIVNYNVRHFVLQCIDSLFRAETYMKAHGLGEIEVFVFDNHSPDNSIDYLKKKFKRQQHPNLHLIAHQKNLGFGKANNLAARRAKGEYLLFINPDTFVAEDTLANCLLFAESHADMGALGVRMLSDTGRYAPESKRGLPTPWTAFCKLTGLTALFPHSKRLANYYMGHLSALENNAIDIVSGAFMMVRNNRKSWFDEDYFMYGEDIDLSYCLLKEGLQNYYLPTPIVHYKGESTKKSSYRYVHIFYEAMYIFFKKHYRHSTLLLSIPIKTAIVGRALLTYVANQLRSAKKFLRPHRPVSHVRWLYLGQHRAEIEKLAWQHGLDIGIVEASESDFPNGHFEKAAHFNKHHFVIYDTDSFSFAHIIQIMSRQPGNTRLATFLPRRRLLLTGSEAFQL